MRSAEGKIASVMASTSAPEKINCKLGTWKEYLSTLPTSGPETHISEFCMKQQIISENKNLYPDRGGDK